MTAARGTPQDGARSGSRFVALLRGVNVGGRNAISMADLAASFRDAGYDDVSTYLQSGNVLFTARRRTGAALETELEAMLEQRFGIPLLVVVRSRDELAATIDAAPPDHGSSKLRSEVIFLKRPLTAADALAEFPDLRDGVDSVTPGPGAIYFSRVAARATKTRIQLVMAMPICRQMTMRTWRTCTALLDKLDAS
ncbi:uncharacterized protein (DUF1697 family) [Agromyces flavus]|uniref:Uncharacterized conserved protein, DUF1697 family n=1 Tax=Agromyces flavus TaxID=589382 RepID=A0A1H1ZZP8_9MICO|nr:DUF1697 domain-containing protein [Agromyces flavus]MCP2367362.1 uncharacterized protein (DUF1697 family) [Agromyces flavus]GGI45878.1 hypothetical protein GCM10010932_11790 [Agromyces flavus]SDT39245.1 Uncharacterized conserved protein, DUF1697 family [Agromyces flavus]